MKTTIPSEAALAKNKLDAGTWFWRADLTMPNDEELHFSQNTEVVTICSTEYVPIPFKLGELSLVTGGAINGRTMEISNVDIIKICLPYIEEYGGVRNAKIVLTRVFYNSPDIDMSALSEIYTVLNSSSNEKWLVLNLGGSNLMRQAIPLRRYTYVHCAAAKDFKGPECQYAGGETSCDGTYATCKGFGNHALWGGELCLRAGTAKRV